MLVHRGLQGLPSRGFSLCCGGMWVGAVPHAPLCADHARQHVACACGAQQGVAAGVDAGGAFWGRQHGARAFQGHPALVAFGQNGGGLQPIALYRGTVGIKQPRRLQGVRCQQGQLVPSAALLQCLLPLTLTGDLVQRIGIQHQARAVCQQHGQHVLHRFTTATAAHGGGVLGQF